MLHRQPAARLCHLVFYAHVNLSIFFFVGAHFAAVSQGMRDHRPAEAPFAAAEVTHCLFFFTGNMLLSNLQLFLLKWGLRNAPPGPGRRSRSPVRRRSPVGRRSPRRSPARRSPPRRSPVRRSPVRRRSRSRSRSPRRR